ncbi:MAG: flagellar motor switch protein FliM [Lachnospiraceae bacterium]|nr:flagellar motor switch protein FliM [Lachnospiraceae bacterium]
MGDVLSQSEIDELLSAFSKGEFDVNDTVDVAERSVKDYDFARPSKFSKDHLRTLVFIFEHYARLLSTNLPVYLRKNVQVEVLHSEATTYSEFSNALSNPVILGIVSAEPLNGNFIIEIADSIGFAILDRMLGGGGIPLDKSRDFTDIELSILEKIMCICIEHLIEPWQSVVDIVPSLEQIETNSQFAQFISPNEMTSIITMNIKIGSIEGLMNVCIPFTCLEDVIDRLNTKYWYATLQANDDGLYREAIESAISKASIPVRALLGHSMISVNDFVGLVPGDIIKLDTKIDDELEVYVGNLKKFNALPGASSDSYAMRITSIIREE